VVDQDALRVAVSTACGVLLLLALVASFLPPTAGRRLMELPGFRRLQRHVTEPRQILWVPLFLVAYPVIALLLDQKANVLGRYFEGVGVFVIALVFNLLYLGFIWSLVHSRWVVSWSIVEFWRRTVGTLRHIAASAPLLLLAVAVLALTAETWQIAYELPREKLIMFCGLQLVFAALLGIGWAVPRICRQSRFKSWDKVIAVMKRARLRDDEHEHREHNKIIDDLVRAVEAEPVKPDIPKKLGAAAWANALLVVAAYQFFPLPVIIAVLFVAFLAICYMIPAELAAEWIFGDGERGRWVELVGLSPLDSPWVRVPLLLTVFSILYFAAHSLASTQRRQEYLKRGDAAIRIRFAIRLGLWFVREMQDERRRAHNNGVPRPDLLIPAPAPAPRRGTPLPSHR
jgi:hypothetical protein